MRLPQVQLPFRRIALFDANRLREIAEAACGAEPVPIKPPEPFVNLSSVQARPLRLNASSSQDAQLEIPPPAEAGLCAQVLVKAPLAAEVASGEDLGAVTGLVVNASGHGIPSVEVCLGWEDTEDVVDELSGALAAFRQLNPVAVGVYGPWCMSVS